MNQFKDHDHTVVVVGVNECYVSDSSLFLELTVQMHVCPSRGKRQWKHFYAHLKGFLLYFAPISGSILLEISIANGAVGWYQFP